jgi:hypothetical protein
MPITPRPLDEHSRLAHFADDPFGADFVQFGVANHRAGRLCRPLIIRYTVAKYVNTSIAMGPRRSRL